MSDHIEQGGISEVQEEIYLGENQNLSESGIEIRKRRKILEAGGLNQLLSRVETVDYGDSFKFYRELINEPENAEFLKKILFEKPLIDLGCGDIYEDEIGEVAEFAKEFGAKKYIGIDKYRVGDEVEEMADGKFCVEYVGEDMLKYIFNLPDNSVNVVLNGINHEIIDDWEYIQTLISEIARIIPVGGVAIGYESPFLQILGEDFGFKKVQLPSTGNSRSSITEELSIWQKEE